MQWSSEGLPAEAENTKIESSTTSINLVIMSNNLHSSDLLICL